MVMRIRRESNGVLRTERDLRFHGIGDEALRFDIFHNFAATLELGLASKLARGRVTSLIQYLHSTFSEQALGFAFVSDQRQTFGITDSKCLPDLAGDRDT
jgi:hypothetical protein